LGAVPARDAIRARLEALVDHARFGRPRKHGGTYFYTRNDGLQDQSVLYATDGIDGEPRVLLDPNTFSEDGTVSLAGWSPNEDGTLLAYAKSDGGSDWKDWYLLDVQTGEPLPDHLTWIKFSGANWHPDGSGFHYSRFPEVPEGEDKLTSANEYSQLFFHKVGTPQSEDALIYGDPEHPKWSFYGGVTQDSAYFVLYIGEGTDPRNRLWLRPAAGEGEWQKLFDDYDAYYWLLGNVGSTFYIQTDKDAPKGRVFSIDVTAPEAGATEVLAEREETLQSATLIGGRLVATWLKDAHTQAELFELNGTPVLSIALPSLGTADGFGGRQDDTETFYSFSSYLAPTTIYRLDVATGESTVFRTPEVDFDPSAFETKQVFYESKDGTRVPMFLVHKTGLVLDGDNPTLLYGYGGFDISITPRFSVSTTAWMEMGGVAAVANLRGGGEYGRQWHEAGTKLNKQNVFDDFIAAGEWLIANGYTRTEKLAIEGRSNGGLLVGACLIQRPDLFGAALPAVGVLDMLRYHKFTIGWAWASDYGTAEDPDEFNALLAYSPVHNVTDGTAYPATFISTGDHDDRVVPAHSFKFAAALQKAQTGSNPILIRIETRAGHGAGKSTSMWLDERSDQLAFLVRALEIEVQLPEGASDETASPDAPASE
jgi:prolyl oligopeptidase